MMVKMRRKISSLEELIEINKQIKARGGIKPRKTKMPFKRNDRIGRTLEKSRKFLRDTRY